jgi:hypothetical protein
MPELRWRFGYPLVMGAMGFIALLMLWYFVRKGWIGPEDLPATGLLARQRRPRR